MVNARRQPDPHPRLDPILGRGRFNVLITEDDRPRGEEYWVRQFPRLLEPQGVSAYIARSGEEAINLAEHHEFHAAIIDLGTPKAPIDPSPLPGAGRGAMWLLELFRRLPQRPPTVVVTSRRYPERDLDRFLREALRLGAFSVIHQPIDLERMLAVFRTLLDRQYRGHGPPRNHPRPRTSPTDDS